MSQQRGGQDLSARLQVLGLHRYNHRDRKAAAWLHHALETYRLPRRLVSRRTEHGELGRRLAPVFRDREELAASGDLAASVRRALEESANLIVICAPAAAASRWVNEEIRSFTGSAGATASSA
jgi:hypothetical protein